MRRWVPPAIGAALGGGLGTTIPTVLGLPCDLGTCLASAVFAATASAAAIVAAMRSEKLIQRRADGRVLIAGFPYRQLLAAAAVLTALALVVRRLLR